VIVGIDDLDKSISAALQVSGRATWGQIARALGIAERTVARRGQRLLDSGLVRISTSIDAIQVAHARPLLLRIKTASRDLWAVARALASRSDASSVSILEGSNDIAAMLLVRDQSSIRSLLFEELPDIDGILQTNVTTVLKFYRTGYDWTPAFFDPDQLAVLREGIVQSPPQLHNGETTSLTEEEDALVRFLAKDGRASFASIATELGIAHATAKRRLDSLLSRGLLHVRTEVVPAVFGFGIEALVWLRAPMATLDIVGQRLAADPAVKFCAASTGASPLLINALFRDEYEFYNFFARDLFAESSGIEVVESLVVVTPVLRGSLLVDDGPIALR